MPIKGQPCTPMFFVTENGLPKMGDAANITAYRLVDGIASTIAASVAEVDATNAKGFYRVALTGPENSGSLMAIAAQSSTSANIVSAGAQWTNEVNVGAISEDEAAADSLKSACDNYSAERGLAGTALPAAAAGAAGGIPVSAAGGLDMDSLSTYDGSDTAGTTTLLSRLTAARALLMDNMDVAISVIQSQITALNNLSAKCNWFGSLLMEIPEGMATRDYIFELVVKDDEDKLVNLDAVPTITLVNASGADRSSLITSAPLLGPTATGRYQITLTVASGTDNESLTLRAEGAVGGDPRYAMLGLQVVDYDVATKTNEILTKLGTPTVTVSDDIASVQTSVTSVGSDVTTLLGRIPAALFAGITSLAQWLGTLAGKSTADATALAEIQATDAGTTYDNGTDSLEAIRDHGGTGPWTTGAGGGGGTGDSVLTITVKNDSAEVVSAVPVTIQTDAGVPIAGYGAPTNGSGIVAFNIDNGDYKGLVTVPDGYETHAAEDFTVSGNTAVELTITASPGSFPPAVPGICNVICYVKQNATAIEGATITASVRNKNSATSGVALSRRPITVTTDSDGYAVLPLVRQDQFTDGDGVYVIEMKDRRAESWKIEATIPNQDTANLDDLIDV